MSAATDEFTKFQDLLMSGSRELFEDNPQMMTTGALQRTPNVIHVADLGLFFRGIEAGLITLHRGARFNTKDRPVSSGRWGLLSRGRTGGWYNAEYLPQIAAYVDAVETRSFHHHRVLFELPDPSLKLDLAVLDDAGTVVVLGEAARPPPTVALDPDALA